MGGVGGAGRALPALPQVIPVGVELDAALALGGAEHVRVLVVDVEVLARRHLHHDLALAARGDLAGSGDRDVEGVTGRARAAGLRLRRGRRGG